MPQRSVNCLIHFLRLSNVIGYLINNKLNCLSETHDKFSKALHAQFAEHCENHWMINLESNLALPAYYTIDKANLKF